MREHRVDSAAPRRSRREAAAAIGAVGFVVAVGLMTLTTARADALPTEDLLLTVASASHADAHTATSAPGLVPMAAGGAVPLTIDASSMPLPDALVAADHVPVTGGQTDLIRKYFGVRTVEAITIVQCESGFDAGAVGTNTNGTQDHGLFQINDVHERDFERVTERPWSQRYDPEVNTAFAAWLFHSGRGWTPWTCAKNLGSADNPLAD